jgi:succinate-semialdehyde dehydrogenase / glutarate-semialdehyde dehydrogenase
MTTEQGRIPAPTTTPPITASTTVTSSRPAWVTDELVARWCEWVRRDVTRHGSSAPEPTTALAPADLSPTAAVPTCAEEDVASAVVSAREAGREWAESSIARRGEVALAFHDLLLERQEQVLDLIQWETGKARYHAWQEVAQVATIARHYARRARHYLAPRRVRGMVPGLTKVREVRVPKGVVGVISPWNYPLYLGVGDVLPALLAGNAVVSKADSQTALTLLWTRDLMAEAGLPEDLWQIVTGSGPVVGTALVDTVDFVCFTGSTATGRTVAERAARRLVGASLELGGKNPLIVREDADVAAAAAGTAVAAFANTGQMCIHIERVYVHEKVYATFRDELVRVTEALRLGQAYDYSTDVGSLVSPAQLAAVEAHIEDAVGKGATVLVGGKARPDLGPLFYEPTVLEGVTPTWTSARRRRSARSSRCTPTPPAPTRSRWPTREPTACRRRSGRATAARRNGWPAVSAPARSTSTTAQRPRPAASRPGWAAWVTAALAGATASRASSSTPRARPSPGSDSCRSARPRSRRPAASSPAPTASWP